MYERASGPTSMDPAYWINAASREIEFNIYENLLGYLGNDSSTLVPFLAQNYTASPDGLTYTFNLRQGITFSDGTRFNASAVVFSFYRGILADSGTSTANYFVGTKAPGLVTGTFAFSHTFGKGSANYTQAQVDALINSHGAVVGASPYQVIFHLGYADPLFVRYLAYESCCSIVSPTFVTSHWNAPKNGHGYITGASAGMSDPYMSNHTAGTGPYFLKSWDTATGNVVLNANPTYWGGPQNLGPAHIQEVDINVVTSNSARVLDLKSGASQIGDISTSDYFSFFDKTTWLTSQKIVPTSSSISVFGPYPSGVMWYVGMNFQIRNPDGTVASFQPWQNKNMRFAMADALNLTDIVRNAAAGFGVAADGPLPVGSVYYNSHIPTYYGFNLAQSKSNLSAAASALGFSTSNPKTITFIYMTGDNVGQAVATEISTNINNMNLGITINAVAQSAQQEVGAVVAGTASLFWLQFSAGTPAAIDMIIAFGTGNTNIGAFIHYNNTAVNNLVLQAASSMDPKMTTQFASQAISLMNQGAEYIWVYYPTTLGQSGQIFSSSVKGFQENVAFTNAGLSFYQLSFG